MTPSRPDAQADAQAGVVRPARRPEGWTPGGPPPAGPGQRAELWPGPGEDLCYLSGDWRIFQLIDGHRWSLDDHMTAWYALEHAPAQVTRAVDLGCGIGSVLMMVAWGLPHATMVGVEAQAVSAALARRSLAYNGAEARVTVRDGDLRDPGMLPEGAVFDLVTGTPPYFDTRAGTTSEKPQCAPCRFELRGGVEDYCKTAARVLAPGGRFVVCEGGHPPERTLEAIRAAGLAPLTWQAVIPREGKAALFWLFSACHPDDAPHAPVREPDMMVRDRALNRSPEFIAARLRLGIPP